MLHHGTLLYAFDLQAISRYLRPSAPANRDYREQREHQDFLLNLPFGAEDLKRRLRETWAAKREETTWPAERVQQLCEEKYEREEWGAAALADGFISSPPVVQARRASEGLS